MNFLVKKKYDYNIHAFYVRNDIIYGRSTQWVKLN